MAVGGTKKCTLWPAVTLEFKSNGTLFKKKTTTWCCNFGETRASVLWWPHSVLLFSPLRLVQFCVAAPNCPFLSSSSHFHSAKEELLLRPEKAFAPCVRCGGKRCSPHRSRLSGRRVKFQVVVFTAHHNKDLRHSAPFPAVCACRRRWPRWTVH